MASPIYTPSFNCSTYVRNSKPAMYSLAPCSCSYYSPNSCLKTPKFLLSLRFSQMGSCHFTPWDGLRYMGISISPKRQKKGRRETCKGKVVYASLFGVGAPEVLVIGVVALLVFGPKGLAEVARNLGKTLRTFQPTIRELQEVSREFKNTLEREIGLDDDPRSMSNTYGSNRANTSDQSVSNVENSQTDSVADPNAISANNAYSSEEYLKITEEQLKASTAAQQDAASSPPESQIEIGSQSQGPPVSETTQQDVASPLPKSQIEVENQTQAAVQPQKPETET